MPNIRTFNNLDEFLKELLIESCTKLLPFDQYDIIKIGDNEEIDISNKDYDSIYNLLRLVGQKYYEGDKDRLYVLFVKFFLFPAEHVNYDRLNDVNETMKKIDVLNSYISIYRLKGKTIYFVDKDGNKNSVVFDRHLELIENPELVDSFYEENAREPLINSLIDKNGITTKYHDAFNGVYVFYSNLNPHIYFITFADKNILSVQLQKMAEKISSLGFKSELMKKILSLLNELDSYIIDEFTKWLKNPTQQKTLFEYLKFCFNMFKVFLNHTDITKAMIIFQYLGTLSSDELYENPIVQKMLSVSLNTDLILTVNILKRKTTFDEVHQVVTHSCSMLFDDTERKTVPNFDILEIFVVKKLEKSLSTEAINKVKNILKEYNNKSAKRIRITIRYKKWEIIIEF